VQNINEEILTLFFKQSLWGLWSWWLEWDWRWRLATTEAISAKLRKDKPQPPVRNMMTPE
jgi:hypothetical protein